MAKGSPTIHDVARHAGVSAMTVSRCLRNQANVKPTTRTRVEAAVAELGYRRHPYVQALMSSLRQSGGAASNANLAYLSLGDAESWSKEHRPTAGTIATSREAAERNGFDLTVIWAGAPDLNGPRLAAILRARNCQGFIIGPPEGSQSLSAWEGFPWPDFAAVGIGLSPALPPVPRVATNQYHLMQQVLRRLRASGEGRIGLALSPAADSRVDGLWLAAYLRHQKRNQPGKPIPVLDLQDERKMDAAAWKEWSRTHRVGATVSNLSLPVSSAGMERNPWVHLYAATIDLPDGTRLQRDFAELGAAATRMLMANLIVNERGLPETAATYLIDAKFFLTPELGHPDKVKFHTHRLR